MDDLARLIVLLAVAGAALTLLGGVVIWRMDEGRRTRRGLKIMLGGAVHGLLVARGRGRGMGFNFATNQIACAWDQGAWGLVFEIDELIGAEAIADGQVVARVHRGETRRALDSLGGAEKRVALRLAFNDVTYPEFVLDLWLPLDGGRRDGLEPEEALEECNRWLARIEALFRRPPTMRATPAAAVAAPPPVVPPPLPAFADIDDTEDEDADEAIT
ncbi:MAG: hypothetical protein JWQ29_3268 [Phenylobacterium sp.]|nr:hypothetical protein [Phenylobacterium sp.]